MKTIALSICALGAATLGVCAQAPKVDSTTTKVILGEPAKPSPEVGVSAHDGITMSGADLMMTRNGSTEKVTKALELENGTKVLPNGTITTASGAKVVLRSSQILTFDGRLINLPAEGASATITTTKTTTLEPAPTTPATPAVIEKTVPVPAPDAAAAAAAAAEAARRARAAEEK